MNDEQKIELYTHKAIAAMAILNGVDGFEAVNCLVSTYISGALPMVVGETVGERIASLRKYTEAAFDSLLKEERMNSN